MNKELLYCRQPDYDFAILELVTAIDLTRTSPAKAVNLPEPTDINFSPGTNFTVSGWGALCERCNSPSKLQYVTVPAILDSKCREAYDITPRMICAGNVEDGGIDSCKGDSGGKLIQLNYYLLVDLSVLKKINPKYNHARGARL